jgi:hypothetical protein
MRNKQAIGNQRFDPPRKPTWVASVLKTEHTAVVSWDGDGWYVADLNGLGATNAARKDILDSLATHHPTVPIALIVGVRYVKGFYLKFQAMSCWDHEGRLDMPSLAQLPRCAQPDFNATILNPLVDLETAVEETDGDWLNRVCQAGLDWAINHFVRPVWYTMDECYTLDKRGSFVKLQMADTHMKFSYNGRTTDSRVL